MAILKTIGIDYNNFGYDTPDALLRQIFEYNDYLFFETDINGSQLTGLNPNMFFGINRVINFKPIEKSSGNRFDAINYDCILTIAKPSNASLEVETLDVLGQFDTITKEFLTLNFLNTFASYFKCVGFEAKNISIKPVWNINTVLPAVNYSGVEISFSIIM